MTKIKEIEELALRILTVSQDIIAVEEGLNDIIEICNRKEKIINNGKEK